MKLVNVPFLFMMVFSLACGAFSETPTPAQGQEASASPNPAKQRRRIATFSNEPMFNQSPEVLEKMNDPQEPFNGYYLRRSIGLEGGLPLGGLSTLSTSILSSPALSYSVWNSPTSGWEFFFGTSKTPDTVNASEVFTPTYSGTTVTAAETKTTFSGAANPRSYLVGLAYKHRLYQVKHFGLSLDFLATFIPKRSTTYKMASGTTTVTVSDVVNAPTNYSVNENYTTRETSVSSTFGFGPRFNVEYNFPYLPNLLFGVSTGMFVNLGAESTNLDTTTNKTTPYTGGVAGNPTLGAGHGKTTKSTTDPGANGGTYGVGGTGLNFGGAGLIPITVVGTFRIRYAF